MNGGHPLCAAALPCDTDAAAAAASQAPAGKAKYARSEIVLIKEIFDSYDRDKSGSISQAELRDALVKQKEAQNREKAGKKEKPKESKGVDLLQLIDPIFHQMDTNNDGTVEFPELLKVLYPRANDAEFKTMLAWVEKELEPEPEVKPPSLARDGG